MLADDSRHFLIAKINVITESKKHTVLSETFSLTDMRLRYSLPNEFLDRRNPIIFQIVYQTETRTYIFNVLGTATSESATIVTFSPESLSQVQQFLNDVIPKKKVASE